MNMYKCTKLETDITVSFAQVSHKTYKYTPTQSYSSVLTVNALYWCKNTGSACVSLRVCLCLHACIYSIHHFNLYSAVMCERPPVWLRQ